MKSSLNLLGNQKFPIIFGKPTFKVKKLPFSIYPERKRQTNKEKNLQKTFNVLTLSVYKLDFSLEIRLYYWSIVQRNNIKISFFTLLGFIHSSHDNCIVQFSYHFFCHTIYQRRNCHFILYPINKENNTIHKYSYNYV